MHALRVLANALPTTARLHAEERRACLFCGLHAGDALPHLVECELFSELVFESSGARLAPHHCLGFRSRSLVHVVACCELYLVASHYQRDSPQRCVQPAQLERFARAAWLKATALARR